MSKREICAFTLRIPVEMKVRLDMLAHKDHRSTNNLITKILQDFLSEQDVKK